MEVERDNELVLIGMLKKKIVGQQSQIQQQQNLCIEYKVQIQDQFQQCQKFKLDFLSQLTDIKKQLKSANQCLYDVKNLPLSHFYNEIYQLIIYLKQKSDNFFQMRNKLQESVNLNKQLKLEVQKLRTVVFDTNIPKNQKHKQVFETFNKEILIKDLLIHDQQIEIQGLLKLNQSKQQEIKYLKLKNGQIETQKLSVSQNLDNLSSIMQEYQKSTNEVEYLKDEVDQIAGVLLKEEQFYKQKCILLETQLQQKCELLEQAQLEIYDYKIDIQTKDEIIEKQNKSNSFKYKQNVQLRRELNDIREEVLNTTNKQDNQEADITPQNIRQQNLLKINQSQQIYIQRLEDALYSANDQAALDVQLQSPELNYYKQQNVLQSQEISLLKLQTQQHQCNKVLQGSPDDQKTVVEQLHLLRKIYNNMQGNAQDQLIALQISNNELKQQLNIVFHQHELFQKAENPLYINAHQQILQYRYLIDQLRDHIQQQNQIINVGYF